MNKALRYIIILLFLTSCNSAKKDPINKEFNQQLKIKKLNKFKSKPFFKNNSNNNGNINFDTNFKNIFNYKIKKIKKFKSNQPELFFTNDGKLIFFNGVGTIFKLDKDLKKIWELNNYNKKEKKLSPILYFAQTGENLIVNDNLSKMYSVNLANGKINWSITFKKGSRYY